MDIVSSRSVTGTFVAKDDMTMAVGGLIKEVESAQESKIPILGSIPLLGWLFRSTERVKQRTELIVLVRPHVISTPAEGEDVSRRVLDATAVHGARDGRSTLGVIPSDPFGPAPESVPAPAPPRGRIVAASPFGDAWRGADPAFVLRRELW